MKKLQDIVFTKKINYLNEAQFKQQVNHYRLYFNAAPQFIHVPMLLQADISKKECHFEYVKCDVSLLDLFREYMDGCIAFGEIEGFFSVIMLIMESNLVNRVVHGDLVLHNIYIDDNNVILIDCFPPCDLPDRLDYFSWKDEYCGFLFNVFSNIKIQNFLSYKKLIPIVSILTQGQVLDNFNLVNLFKCSHNSGVDFYKIKSKYHSKFKTAIKTIFLSSLTFLLLAYERYTRN